LWRVHSLLKAEIEGGTAVADVCRQVGISEATFYIWKKKYARSLGGTEIRELRQLREENAKLKRLVAESGLYDARRKNPDF
jgi:putative transposase